MNAEGDDLRREIAAFLDVWGQANIAADAETAARLRASDYRAVWPDGTVMTAAEEIAAIVASPVRAVSITTRIGEIEASRGAARAAFALHLEADGPNGPFAETLHCRMMLARDGGTWRAKSLEMNKPRQGDRPQKRLRVLLARVGARLARRRRQQPANGHFQGSAYYAFRPGQDYALPLSDPPAPVFNEADLPLPPEELWLGYAYPGHGALHVRTMLDILTASGFTLQPGDRILDLGCGAGRMIRHLAPQARSCEIWGADISAPHIQWCERHLTPPFHFLTSTKVPHLPFPDGFFSLIYCGSLFTHIDDLAKTWLLELRRLLAPEGRAYLTIHDEETIRQLEAAPRPSEMMRTLRGSPSFKAFKDGSDMFTADRDDLSQVFYNRGYFERLMEPAFEMLSATPSAYYYQSAILARPRRLEVSARQARSPSR
jgi:SAM-dependent methyltransferase